MTKKKTQTHGEKIAVLFDVAEKSQRIRYNDLIVSARNPFEYGMLGRNELLAKVADEYLTKTIRNLKRKWSRQ